MRSDMAKVIVERPRTMDGFNKGRRNPYIKDEAEDLPKFQGMRRPHIMNYAGKRLNENLGPLKRYLRSQVGRLWDDVFSEICENINIKSATQKHIRDHIKDFVQTDITMIDNVPHTISKYSDRGLSPIYNDNALSVREHLYVDPSTGILSVVKDKRRKEKKSITLIKLSEHEYYNKIKGCWFYVETYWKELYSFSYKIWSDPDYNKYGQPKQIMLSRQEIIKYDDNRKAIYGVVTRKVNAYKAIKFKRQLSKKEIRKLKKDYAII